MNQDRILSFFEQRRDALFYTTLVLSIVLHVALLVDFSSSVHGSQVLSAQKGSKTYINFSFKDSSASKESEKKRKQRIKQKIKDLLDNKKTIPSFKTKMKAEQVRQSRKSVASRKSMSKEAVLAQKTYMSEVAGRIHRAKYYPSSARRMRKEGTVTVQFVIARDGSLIGEVQIVDSSEYSILNRAGLKTILKAAPFPAFPENIKSERMKFVVPVEYKLNL